MPAHWLRPNERTKTPVRVICLDSEARVRHSEHGSEHHFRLAVASFDVRRETDRAKCRTDWAEHGSKDDLWRWVSQKTSTNHATWLYAHNLEYDLTVTGAWQQLPALGWTIAARAAGGTAPWVRWKQGDRSLIMADLAGWAHRKLSDVGSWVGVPKAAMPRFEAPDADWFAYCRRDVEVLRAAILRLMDWVDVDDLGNWSLSSAGMAWRTFRHRYMHDKVLVHDDQAALLLERQAGFGGRREVFAVGRWTDTPIVDLDFRNHYMTVAGRSKLPIRLAGVLDQSTPAQLEQLAESLCVIADVDVETDRPCVPVRTPAGIIYPVGHIRTTLAGPELSLVAEIGQVLKVRQVAVYHGAPLLEPWAQWLAGRLDEDSGEQDKLRRHVLKAWSRELIGKFGQRASELRRIGDQQQGRGPVEPFYPAGDRTATPVVNRNDGVWLADRSQPAENAIPSIMAYVTSASRVALWRALETVGWGNVLSCDTDGFLAHAGACERSLIHAPGARLVGAGDAWAVGSQWAHPDSRYLPGRLVCKRMITRLEIRSPEAMIVDGKPRVAGMPRSASRVADWEFQGEVWPGADWQLQHRGEADYVTVVRPHTVRAGYTRRRVLDDGTTEPWACRVIHGVNVIPGLGLE